MKLLLMYDAQVGCFIAEWLLENYPGDIGAVVALNENAVCGGARSKGIHSFLFESETRLLSDLSNLAPFDLGILAWWPKLISPAVIALASGGFINTHPSLLPYNRGKHYNFWALVEQVPFGVSLHFVDEGIDSGDIVAQLPITYDWEDTGETLYVKATQAMVKLFKLAYPQIHNGSYQRVPQDLNGGSLHYAKELDIVSKIDLNKNYNARELINLLRARTFFGYPSCHFEENGVTYEISVNIKRNSE
jgi:methionyl-tRNA formyltransferase